MQIIRIFILAIAIFCVDQIDAQDVLWTRVQGDAARILDARRYIKPEKYLTFQFDYPLFKSKLDNNRRNSGSFDMQLPLPDGNFILFHLTETNIFEEALQQAYPGFTSFTGISDEGDILKLSYSPFGINGMIISEKYGYVFIDPLTLHDHQQYYQVYNKVDFKKKTGNFTCGVKSDERPKSPQTSDFSRVGDCQLRTYRLAISCTGEYASFHGGTKEKVLAAYNATMTRVNGVYETDAGITMKLVANTDKLIFTSASSDPFTNSNGDAMLDQNQTTIDNLIGKANYDIGHVFSTGGGGIAQLRSPCSSSKAMGVTGQPQPVGDPFDIDYVAHEMGHQFGANHTQNNSCQRETTASVEPGSGSTIMGYAGICEPNVQNNSDAYFHGLNLGEITSFVVAGNGNTCAVRSSDGNSKPLVSVQKNAYTIPVSTPFVLTAAGTDADGDILTYCWEQVDPEVTTMPPTTTSTKGPAFRSVKPSSNPTRYFPDLTKKYGQWESLPTVSRIMDFRCTVRDNHTGLGCTDETDVRVTTTSAAGPFVVNNPNTATVTWPVGSKQTVTWNVANTDVSPVSCAIVNIYLSTDGGITYPIVIAENLANNGSAEIDVPSYATTKAKVMVKAADNIFFDVSNFNFKIVSSFNVTTDIKSLDVCIQDEFTTNLVFTQNQPINAPIELTVLNPIAGLTYDFSPNSVTDLQNGSILRVTGLQNLPKGVQTITIQAQSGNEKLETVISLFVGITDITAFKNISPELNSVNINEVKVPFIWEKVNGVINYTLEVSTSPTFVPSVLSTTVTDTSYLYSLSANTVYFWRVKPNSPCLQLPFGETFTFKTKGSVSGIPILLKNETLVVKKGQTATIDSTHLSVKGENFNFISFTLTKIPANGLLEVNGVEMKVGSVFTMENIQLLAVQYIHGGRMIATDAMTFNILDDKGRWLPDVTFHFLIDQGALGVSVSRVENLKCNGDKNALIQATGFGGTSPYFYSLDGNTYQTSDIFEGLSDGKYVVFVKDANNQVVKSDSVTFVQPSPIDLKLTVDKYDIGVDASGGTGFLSMSIDNLVFSNIAIVKDPGNGTHEIFVKDELGCLVSDTVNINVEPLIISAQIVKDVTCPGQNANFEVNASGGFPPYTYSSNNNFYVTGNSFTRPQGKYIFYVKDAAGKISFSDSIFTNNPKPIEISFIKEKLKVQVIATGGTGKFIYSTNNVDFSENNTFEFSNNGTYKIYVKDSLGCSKLATLTLNVLKDVNITKRDISCFGKNDGYVKLLASNGALPITYSFDNSAFSSNNEWTNLSAGIYKYTVKDNINDSLTGEIMIVNPDSITFDALVSGRDLTINVAGGTPPFQYSLDGGGLFLETNQYSDLPVADYNIVVKDKNGCIVTGLVQISSLEDNNDHPLLRILPNPTNGVVYIQSQIDLGENAICHILNAEGRFILKAHISSNGETIIDLKHVAAGVYFAKIVTRNKVLTFKIVKQD